MNAFETLPFALPFIALGTYAAIAAFRWLDRRPSALLQRSIVSNTPDSPELTDIIPTTF